MASHMVGEVMVAKGCRYSGVHQFERLHSRTDSRAAGSGLQRTLQDQRGETQEYDPVGYKDCDEDESQNLWNQLFGSSEEAENANNRQRPQNLPPESYTPPDFETIRSNQYAALATSEEDWEMKNNDEDSRTLTISSSRTTRSRNERPAFFSREDIRNISNASQVRDTSRSIVENVSQVRDTSRSFVESLSQIRNTSRDVVENVSQDVGFQC